MIEPLVSGLCVGFVLGAIFTAWLMHAARQR